MDRFFETLLFFQSYKRTINIDPIFFLKEFNKKIDKSRFGLFSELNEINNSSKNKLKGQLGFDEFIIKEKKGFLYNSRFSVAYGQMKSEKENIKINILVKGLPYSIIYIILFIFLCAFYGSILQFFNGEKVSFSNALNMITTFIPFYLVPLIIARISISSLRHKIMNEIDKIELSFKNQK